MLVKPVFEAVGLGRVSQVVVELIWTRRNASCSLKLQNPAFAATVESPTSVVIRFEDFCDILAQCVNISRISVSIFIIGLASDASDSLAMPHHNLRMLSLEGKTDVFVSIFKRFRFPSLVALRLSYLTPQLGHIHRVVRATPRLKEFHLQFYSFNIDQFIGRVEDRLVGPLSVEIIFGRPDNASEVNLDTSPSVKKELSGSPKAVAEWSALLLHDFAVVFPTFI